METLESIQSAIDLLYKRRLELEVKELELQKMVIQAVTAPDPNIKIELLETRRALKLCNIEWKHCLEQRAQLRRTQNQEKQVKVVKAPTINKRDRIFIEAAKEILPKETLHMLYQIVEGRLKVNED